jgi:4-amino-4-deoxy-L-arabinose transferase-like glycosyltransferase
LPVSPSARAGAPPGWLIGALLILTALRLLAAAAIPLSEDEAYYRLWAASLQLGYFDHPPMIAWWIRAGMDLVGDNPLGVRLIPTLSCGLTGLLVFDLARRLGAKTQVAARASLWLNATLTVAMGGSLATPDAAATPFWVLTLWCLAHTSGRRGVPWWLAAGVAAGLACLSKYSALFLAPGVGLWLAMRPGGLAELKRPWPWAAAVLAAAIFGLNVAWNATHHWATFDKQFGRLAPHGLRPQYLVELIAGQLLLLNPPIAVFVIRGLRAPWRRPDRPGGLDPGLLIATSLPFALYLVAHSLHDRVQAHWPAPIYPALAIIAAAAAEDIGASRWLAGLKASAAPLGIGLAVLVLGHLALPITDLRAIPDRASAFRGWPQFARLAGRLRDAQGAAWIGTLSYGVAAQLAAAGAPAPVVELNERDRYPAYDGSWRADLSRPGIVIDLQRRATAGGLQNCFAQVTSLGEVDRPGAGGRPQPYAAFKVAEPRWNVLASGCNRP